ncbi:MAG: NADH-quinone oxidoreductase subunit C [Candidatus Micrarchaeota archaeon]
MSKMTDMRADRLVSITCLKDGEDFKLIYHFSLNDDPDLIAITIDVSKGEKVKTIIPRWNNALFFETEVTEFYGLNFEGNPACGTRLFLQEVEK